MPEEEVTEPTTEPPKQTEPAGGEPRGAALESALQKERKSRKGLEQQVRELLADQKKREDADKTEVERLRADVERLTAAATLARKDVEGRKRADLVRHAAKEFADPDDIVALLGDELENIDSESDAERVVKALAKSKPYLLRQPEPTSTLERILHDGLSEPTNGNKPSQANGKSFISQERLVKMSAAEIAALKQSDPALWKRSLDALAGQETVATVS